MADGKWQDDICLKQDVKSLYYSVLTRLRHCHTLSGNATIALAQGVPGEQRKQERKKKCLM